MQDIEPNAAYVHWAAHNFNLVINDIISEVTEVKHFFAILVDIYLFFGWNIFSSFIKKI